jgi:regulator of sigma E protease
VIQKGLQVGQIQSGSPAQKAGLRSTDQIQSIGTPQTNIPISTSTDLHYATQALAGEAVSISIKRDSNLQNIQANLLSDLEVQSSRKTDNPKGYLGVSPNDLQVYKSTWSAPIMALGFTKQLIVLTSRGLWHALQGLGSTIAGLVTNNKEAREVGQDKATEEVGGPVAIVAVIWGSGSLGINFIIMIIAIISLTLAFMNALPIPALDGGRLFVMLSARATGKKLTKRAEELIHGTGMMILLVLILLITLVDVKRFF